MSQTPIAREGVAPPHRRVLMRGRDPHEPHRAATSLELLFDLTFVIAFGAAADQLTELLAEGHVAAGVGGFAFATFAVSWAWINFSWFASAFDTDDWIYRLTTMVQMAGVLLLALGLPALFASLERGDRLDNRVMVLGYVVMRVPMVAQWLRAAAQEPALRRTCRTYAGAVAVAQVGWVVLLLADPRVGPSLVCAGVLILVELMGPLVAETRYGTTPWHAHHMAERYGLVVIIALGEGLLGTTAALSAIIGPGGSGWSVDVVVLGLAGTAIPFGMWWMYFVIPSGDVLAAHRDRAWVWGYGHIVVFGLTVAVGAGMHLAAYLIEGHSELGPTATVLSVAVPLLGFVVSTFVLYAVLTRTLDAFHLVLVAVSVALAAAAVLLASSGVSVEWCLALLALTPFVTVVGYETVGHRHNAAVLAAL